jgi:hypothetical protein
LHDVGGFRSPLTNFPVEWYWKVLLTCFPAGNIITVIRNPFDVLVSRRDHTRWDPIESIRDLICTYEIYEYGWNFIKHKALFSDIVQNFDGYIRSVCGILELDFDPVMLSAQQTSHAPVPNRGPKLDHIDEWSTLPALILSRAEFECVERVWDMLGAPLVVAPSLRIRPKWMRGRAS